MYIMNFEVVMKENQQLKEINEKLTTELEEIRERLKKYTAPEYKKNYYENNKEQIKQKTREYRQTHKPSEEQKKKWARTAYLNKKAKAEKEKPENI